MSSKAIEPFLCPSVETTITRAPPAPPVAAFFSSGHSNAVSAKWPKWLTPKWRSKPSVVKDRSGIAMTPAFSMRTSIGRSPQLFLNDLTELRSPRSSALTSMVPACVACRMLSLAALPLAGSRHASTTVAPASASCVAAARPRPLLPPVTMTVFPAMLANEAAATGRAEGSTAAARPPTSAARRRIVLTAEHVVGAARGVAAVTRRWWDSVVEGWRASETAALKTNVAAITI